MREAAGAGRRRGRVCLALAASRTSASHSWQLGRMTSASHVPTRAASKTAGDGRERRRKVSAREGSVERRWWWWWWWSRGGGCFAVAAGDVFIWLRGVAMGQNAREVTMCCEQVKAPWGARRRPVLFFFSCLDDDASSPKRPAERRRQSRRASFFFGHRCRPCVYKRSLSCRIAYYDFYQQQQSAALQPGIHLLVMQTRAQSSSPPSLSLFPPPVCLSALFIALSPRLARGGGCNAHSPAQSIAGLNE